VHKHTQIRDRIVEMLDDFSNPGIDIFKSRSLEIPKENFPAISVYGFEEKAKKSADEGNYTRLPMISIVCFDKGKDALEPLPTGEKSIDDKLDNLREYVERIFLKQYGTLNGLVYRFNYVSSKTHIDTKTEELVGILNMTWEVIYHQNI